MSEFQNTIDLLGDEAVTKALIERTITEFCDDVLTSIRAYGFAYCTSLERVNLPNLTSCERYGFKGCSSLKTVDFPKLEITTQYLFDGCEKLESVNLPLVNYISSGVFGSCSSLKKLVFPSVTEYTSTYVFNGCTSLEYIDFPVLTQISGGFSGCYGLKSIILRQTSVCTLSLANSFTNTTFDSGQAGGTLLAPRAVVEEYKTATNWSALIANNPNNRVLALEDYTVDGTITGEIDWDKLNGGTTA